MPNFKSRLTMREIEIIKEAMRQIQENSDFDEEEIKKTQEKVNCVTWVEFGFQAEHTFKI